MTLKFNDYALINGYPGGGGQSSLETYVGMVLWIRWHLLPIFSPGWGIAFAESLRKRPQGFVIHLAELAGKENNERSIENVVLSHSLIYKESSTSSHAVDQCRLRPDFELFLRQTKLWFVWILIEFDSWANCKINFRGPSKVSLY